MPYILQRFLIIASYTYNCKAVKQVLKILKEAILLRKTLFVTILLGLILVLAACGGDNNNPEDTIANQDNVSQDEASTASDVKVVSTNWAFDQEEYVVKAGEEVKITHVNEEGMHGISIEGLDISIEGDGEATFTPTEPGEYKIYCNIPCGAGHNDMIATLIVQ